MRRKAQQAAILAALAMVSANAANATDFNAGVVMKKMNAEQRKWYVSGVVDGLAYARFLQDKPSEVGMQCIYDWYFNDNEKLWNNTLIPTFERYSDKPVTAIIHVLSQKKCGAVK
nr:hypothetical protein [uncultured Cohaesibacter sp.]